MAQRDEDALLLFRALGTPFGVLLRTDNAARALQRLNRVKAQQVDPDCARLRFVRSPMSPQDEVFILLEPEVKDGNEGS